MFHMAHRTNIVFASPSTYLSNKNHTVSHATELTWLNNPFPPSVFSVVFPPTEVGPVLWFYPARSSRLAISEVLVHSAILLLPSVPQVRHILLLR